MVSTVPLISKCTSSCINPLVTVTKAPITIGITNHSISERGPGTYPSFRFLSFLLYGQQRLQFGKFFFCCCWLLLGLVVWPRLGEPFVFQNPRGVCASHFPVDSGLCIYHLFVWSNFNFLHNSKWINLPTESCLILYFFCANLLHLLMCDWSFRLYPYLPIPSDQAGYDTRSIFKRSLSGFNSEFSFS